MPSIFRQSIKIYQKISLLAGFPEAITFWGFIRLFLFVFTKKIWEVHKSCLDGKSFIKKAKTFLQSFKLPYDTVQKNKIFIIKN